LSAPFVLFLYLDFVGFYYDAGSASGAFHQRGKITKAKQNFSKKQVLPT
jgi:hypothetical protein